jgi:hypothetical protein
METHRYNALRFEAPEGWIEQSVITFLGPQAAGFRANLMLLRQHAGGLPLEAYVDRQVAALEAQAGAYEAHRRDPLHVDGRPAVLLEHSFPSPHGIAARQIQVYVLAGEYVYVLSATHAEEPFEALREALDSLLQSLRIEG